MRSCAAQERTFLLNKMIFFNRNQSLIENALEQGKTWIADFILIQDYHK